MNRRQLIFSLCAPAFALPDCAGLADKQESDDAIYDHVKRKLTNDPDVKGGALSIDVKDGVVTLRGVLDTDKQIQKAEKLAKKTAGVKKVVNGIKLASGK